MKKVLMLALMTVAVMPRAVAINFVTADNVQYRTLTDSTVTLYTAASFTGVSLVIPSVVENEGVKYQVAEIRQCQSETLLEVTVPESVVYISRNAFDGASLTTLHFNAIDCDGGTPIVRGGEGLTTVTFGPNVKRIPRGLLGSAGVRYVNTNLVTVTIPDGVEYIGDNAFAGCPNLRDIVVGRDSKITYADFTGTAWSGFDQQGLVYVGRYLYSINGTLTGNVAFREGSVNLYSLEGQEQVTSVTVPDGFAELPARMFYGCRALTSVSLPSTLTALGDSAMAYCSALTRLTVPQGVERFGRGTFYGSNLKELAIQRTGTVVEASADCVLDLFKAGTKLALPAGTEALYRATWPWPLVYGAPAQATSYSLTLVDVWGGEQTLKLTDGMAIENIGVYGLRVYNYYDPEIVYELNMQRGLERIIFNDEHRGEDPVVAPTEGKKTAIYFTISPTGVTVQGLPPSTRVTACTIDGSLIFSDTATGSCTLPRTAMPRGVVIIKAGTETLKLMTR